MIVDAQGRTCVPPAPGHQAVVQLAAVLVPALFVLWRVYAAAGGLGVAVLVVGVALVLLSGR